MEQQRRPEPAAQGWLGVMLGAFCTIVFVSACGGKDTSGGARPDSGGMGGAFVASGGLQAGGTGSSDVPVGGGAGIGGSSGGGWTSGGATTGGTAAGGDSTGGEVPSDGGAGGWVGQAGDWGITAGTAGVATGGLAIAGGAGSGVAGASGKAGSGNGVAGQAGGGSTEPGSCDDGYFSDGVRCISWDCVRFVDVNSEATTPDGLDWSTAFPSVQDAIDEASMVVGPACPDGTQVWVAAGTYHVYGTDTDTEEDTIRLQAGVAVLGGFAGAEVSPEDRDWVDHPTVLDGHAFEGSDERVYHVVTCRLASGCGAGARLDGFTVSGGDADGTTAGHDFGAGLTMAGGALDIANCRFVDNSAGYPGTTHGYGAAIYATGATLSIQTSEFARNSIERGGVVDVRRTSSLVRGSRFDSSRLLVVEGDVTILDTVFENSENIRRSALHLSSTQATIDGCTVAGVDGVDGAVTVNQGTVAISRSLFERNDSTSGGAINVYPGTLTVDGCQFIENVGVRGGALYLRHATATVHNSVFRHNASNSRLGVSYDPVGSAIANAGDLAVVNSTFYANASDDPTVGTISSIDAEATTYIANSILWANVPQTFDATLAQSFEVVSSNFDGTWSGSSDNTAEDPRFRNLDEDAGPLDLRLTACSPCIDATTQPAPEFDLEGNTRIGTADQGAYEFDAVGGCSDGIGCSRDIAECDDGVPVCIPEPIDACVNGDGCCPEGCDDVLDDDCSSTCGDGELDPLETCDGDCPTACAEGGACMDEGILVGSAATCSAACVYVPIAECANADGCCPEGCVIANDDDCSIECYDDEHCTAPSTYCDDTHACVDCDTPLHCGSECVQCGEATPACAGVAEGCVCTDGSCDAYYQCGTEGACVPCGTNDACGIDCGACTGNLDRCLADGDTSACVECLSTSDCERHYGTSGVWACTGNTCVEKDCDPATYGIVCVNDSYYRYCGADGYFDYLYCQSYCASSGYTHYSCNEWNTCDCW